MAVLVLDIGSSSARALLFDDQARLIPGAVISQAHQFDTAPPGAATLDAADLRARVESCLDAILQHPAAPQIQVVGLATFVGNVLGIDAAGQPVTPIFTYADSRSAEDVAFLKPQLDPISIHQRTGCLLHTAYQPSRLHWLRRTQPEAFARAAAWVDFATYFYLHWFGLASSSTSVASWSGLLSRSELAWYSRWLEVLGIDESLLPRLADYSDAQRGLAPAYADRWPILRDLPFCLAVGDGAAANIGSGCADDSRIALTVGTTAALRLVSDDILPVVPPGLWSYRLDDTHHLLGGATSEGGNIFRWVRHNFKLEDVAALDEALMSRIPDSHGLTFLPLLQANAVPAGLLTPPVPLSVCGCPPPRWMCCKRRWKASPSASPSSATNSAP